MTNYKYFANRMSTIKRAEWSEEQLREALGAVNGGTSISKASKLYKIPRTTLGLHFRKNNVNKRLGRKSVLTADQENDLVRRIHRLAEVGMPLTPKMVRKSVFSYVKSKNIPNPFSQRSEMAGRKWLKLFFKRHPDIAKRRAQQMNPARAQKMNRFIVSDYFQKLKELMTKLDLFNKPGNIYNIDEKGCRLSLHHQQTVLAKRGAKRVHLTAPEHAENVTIVGCGNALGQAIPPFILFKGIRMKPEWSDKLPPGAKCMMTKKGSMTNEAFVTWISHFASYKNPGPTLLIFDGAASHLDITIVDAAHMHGVNLFCLPSNTTHELQPMDKSVFKSFESYWDEQVLNFLMTQPGKALTKMRFGELFTDVWFKAMSPSNIISGFRATGIYPFNPEIIPDSAYAPSLITEQPNALSDEGNNTEAVPITRQIDFSVLNRQVADISKPSTSGFKNSKKAERSTRNKSSSSDCDLSTYSVHDESPLEEFRISDSSYEYFCDNVPEDPINEKVERISAKKGEMSLQKDTVENAGMQVEQRQQQSPEDPINKKNTRTSEEKGKNKLVVDEVQSVRKLAEERRQQGGKGCEKHNKFSKVSENVAPENAEGSFKDVGLLITPEIKISTAKRRPAINSRAQEVTRKLFSEKQIKEEKKRNLKTTGKAKEPVKNKIQKKFSASTSWYCFLCEEDRVSDMRLCTTCKKYVHEECVGLTKIDKDIFICPMCSV